MDVTAVTVAGFGAAGLVGAAWVTGYFNRGRNQKVSETHEIVKGNGKGNLLELSEKTFVALGRIEEKLDAHIEDRASHGR